MKIVAILFDRITAYTIVIFYIYNLLYALMWWGFWGAVLNVVLPVAMVWDLIGRLGKI